MEQRMADFGRLRQEMADLRTEMGVVASATPQAPMLETGWSRPIDPTILSIVARSNVPKEAVAQALQQLLVDAELHNLTPEATRLEGEEMGRHFKLRCVGAVGLATRRVGKLVGLLRTGPSTWREFAA
eukprot:6107794-Pyramimonas_sp.AAC.1